MKIVWDILEDQAKEKFYIGNAKEPAFLILPKSLLTRDKFTLLINSLCKVGDFKTLKQCHAKLEEISLKINKPIRKYSMQNVGR